MGIEMNHNIIIRKEFEPDRSKFGFYENEFFIFILISSKLFEQGNR